jgi:hypothetical protein
MALRPTEPKRSEHEHHGCPRHAMFDLDAYLERIGLSGRPSITQVHRAHLTSIPFENRGAHQGSFCRPAPVSR